MTGVSSGSRMWRKTCHGPAPSTRATSTTSRSIDCRPASSRMATRGVSFQTSATITIHIARSLSESHGWYAWSTPVWVSNALSAPYSALSIHRHMSALTMVGSAQGRITSVRSNHRQRSGWSISRASPMPNPSSSAVVTIVK